MKHKSKRTRAPKVAKASKTTKVSRGLKGRRPPMSARIKNFVSKAERNTIPPLKYHKDGGVSHCGDRILYSL